MNQDIANYLKGLLTAQGATTAVWISTIAGLVWPLRRTTSEQTSIYPVSCDHNADECDENQYIELIPKNGLRSIIYFEERQGATLVERMPHRIFKYETVLRLVCWFDKRKFMNPSACLVRSLLVHDIISNIDFGYTNSSPYRRIHINSVSEVEHSRDIFSAYTYDEDLSQFMFEPYDFFALDIKLTFELGAECIAEISINPDTTCL